MKVTEAASAGVAVAVIVAVSTIAGGNASALAADNSSVVASGVVQFNGAPSSGVNVSVFAQPSVAALKAADTEGGRLLPLGQASTGTDGSYEVDTDLSTVPAGYVSPAGQVDIVLVASGLGRTLTWNYAVFRGGSAVPSGAMAAVAVSNHRAHQSRLSDGTVLPELQIDLGTGVTFAPGNDPATWVDDAGRALGAKNRAASRAHVHLSDPGLTDYATSYLAATPSSRARLLSSPATAGSLTAADTSGDVVAQAGTGCGIVTLLNSYKTNVQQKFIGVSSASHAKGTVEEGVSGTTSFTVGVAHEVSAGSFSASGTFTQNASIDVTQPNFVNSSASNRINYRARTITCLTGKFWYPSGVYDYLTDFAQISHVNYAYCASKASGATWSTSSASNTTYSSGVSFPGINLSSQQGYGSSVRLSFHFTAAGSVCGNNSLGPANSSLVNSK